MAVYKWEGVTRQGVAKKGEREAPNQAAVITWLRQQQVRPRRIVEKKKKAQIGLPSFMSGVAQKDIVVFARQFATMIDAGLPLVQCLGHAYNVLAHEEAVFVLSIPRAELRAPGVKVALLKRR